MDGLRSRVNKAKALRSSLQAELDALLDLQRHEQQLQHRSTSSPAQISDPQSSTRRSKGDRTQILRALGTELQEIEDRSILCRTLCGWTCFEVDLDVGRRERLVRELQHAEVQQERPALEDGGRGVQDPDVGLAAPAPAPAPAPGAGDKGKGREGLGLGVRIDTFSQGTFNETFYLIFAPLSQTVQNGPAAPVFLQSTLSPITSLSSTSAGSLQLLKHTLPHFVPVQKLVQQYLSVVQQRAGSVTTGGAAEVRAGTNAAARAAGSEVDEGRISAGGTAAAQGTSSRTTPAEVVTRGGFELLEDLKLLDGFGTFLSTLNSHLQAYVSRRGQAESLRNLCLPGSKVRASRSPRAAGVTVKEVQQTADANAVLQAYSTAAFDTISIRWSIPVPNEHELERWRMHQVQADRPHYVDGHDEEDTEEEDDEGTEDGSGQEDALDDPPRPDADIDGEETRAADMKRRKQARLAKRRRPARPVGETQALDVKIQWTDLLYDTLGSLTSSASSVTEAGSTFSATEHGRIIIERVVARPDMKRARTEDGDVHALQSERAIVESKERRKDLEKLFLLPPGGNSDGVGGGDANQTGRIATGKGYDGDAAWTLGSALRRVARKVWDEECKALAS
ncbi:hypothetical protein K437DRAFT_254299 [Tilletiaria anomala UBC 951]|uniref:Uncharacterized protein n=1 Tax=Tilletiaria anomala (strain ATCC 24038 / CBS 436.72 / UBC 951) TaxID=1037660 RepID=A0A066WNY2_TILAU|nr:uncharacterized protein K437DRAFT_254299 [Tilletiaria anomala UBC 951]KDN52315.1 hypothetical protein K437DRAFT_254299 [Tilletiaria anomala UBC 951]